MKTPPASLYSPGTAALAAVALYAAAYGACLALLARAPGFQAGESVGILLIFGLGFTAAASALRKALHGNRRA